MKTRHAILLILAVILVSGSTVLAGGPTQPAIRANVPFAFRVGDQLMPAGPYQVLHMHARDVLVIRSLDDKAAVMVHSISGEYSGDAAKLVFYSYGEAYFLRQVWIPGINVNLLFQSKAEGGFIARRQAPEPVVVVASVDKP